MIRELEDRDLGGLARLFVEVVPWFVLSEAGLRHWYEHEPPRARRRTWVAEEDGEIVGHGSGSLEIWVEREDVAKVDVMVRADRRRRGLGSDLAALAERHVLELGARKLLGQSVDEADAQRFAERLGFEHTMTRRISRLETRRFDPSGLERLSATKRGEGFELEPLAAFADRPELLHALDRETVRDAPLDEPVTKIPLAEWLEEVWAFPMLSKEGSFAVVREGKPVAITWLSVDLDSGRAMNDFTGTLREFRGRGLASLAKLASIAWAAGQGVTSVVTENDESNAAMLAVNTRLGYEPFVAELTWVKEPS